MHHLLYHLRYRSIPAVFLPFCTGRSATTRRHRRLCAANTVYRSTAAACLPAAPHHLPRLPHRILPAACARSTCCHLVYALPRFCLHNGFLHTPRLNAHRCVSPFTMDGFWFYCGFCWVCTIVPTISHLDSRSGSLYLPLPFRLRSLVLHHLDLPRFHLPTCTFWFTTVLSACGLVSGSGTTPAHATAVPATCTVLPFCTVSCCTLLRCRLPAFLCTACHCVLCLHRTAVLHLPAFCRSAVCPAMVLGFTFVTVLRCTCRLPFSAATCLLPAVDSLHTYACVPATWFTVCGSAFCTCWFAVLHHRSGLPAPPATATTSAVFSPFLWFHTGSAWITPAGFWIHLCFSPACITACWFCVPAPALPTVLHLLPALCAVLDFLDSALPTCLPRQVPPTCAPGFCSLPVYHLFCLHHRRYRFLPVTVLLPPLTWFVLLDFTVSAHACTCTLPPVHHHRFYCLDAVWSRSCCRSRLPALYCGSCVSCVLRFCTATHLCAGTWILPATSAACGWILVTTTFFCAMPPYLGLRLLCRFLLLVSAAPAYATAFSGSSHLPHNARHLPHHAQCRRSHCRITQFVKPASFNTKFHVLCVGLTVTCTADFTGQTACLHLPSGFLFVGPTPRSAHAFRLRTVAF